MHILIAHKTLIPVHKYGGIERVIWYLGKELTRIGHKVSFLVNPGSQCEFADIIYWDTNKTLDQQIPNDVDIVHFHYTSHKKPNISKPYIITFHENRNEQTPFDTNTVFLSKNHASRYGSDCFVYNGLDWNDYSKPDIHCPRKYFHFLGNAAWRVKNVKGAIDVVKKAKKEKLYVLGGKRFNLNMGIRLTFTPRATFFGMVGGHKKFSLLSGSKGLIFPVKWHEPFGLAITESLFYGCPVFGTPYGSLPELIHDEVGFLSADSNELVNAIENNNYSPLRCHQYALDNFNANKMALDYLLKYEVVLNGKQLNNNKPKLISIPPKFLAWS